MLLTPFDVVHVGSKDGLIKSIGVYAKTIVNTTRKDWAPRLIQPEGSTVHAGNYPLDTNSRHRLAVARIKMGDVEEGMVRSQAYS